MPIKAAWCVASPIIITKRRPAPTRWAAPWEAELISGVELGDWRDRVLVPHDVPCFVTTEEQIAWGGINSASHWDADLVAERRRPDMRGKGLGLICRFVAALCERGVPMLTTQPLARLALDSGRVTGVVMGSGELIAARRGVLLATGGYGAEHIRATLCLHRDSPNPETSRCYNTISQKQGPASPILYEKSGLVARSDNS
jgi:hypothetical protein